MATLPKADRAKAESRRNEALEHGVARLQRKLQRVEQIIEAQKKLCELLGLPMGRGDHAMNTAPPLSGFVSERGDR